MRSLIDDIRLFRGTLGGAIENRGIINRITVSEYFETAAGQTLVRTGSGAAFTLLVTHETLTFLLVGIMIRRTFVITLRVTFIASAFLAHLLMETIAGTEFATRMAFATNGLASQRLQRSLLPRIDILPVVAIGTFVVFQQTGFNGVVRTNDGQVTGFTTSRTNGVVRTRTALTGGVAAATSAIVGEFVLGTDGNTTILISDMDALIAMFGIGSRTSAALGMALFAGFGIKLIGTGRRRTVEIRNKV